MSLEYWGSHLPDLICCLMNTTGDVLEIGGGTWSTPIIYSFCHAAQRKFVSIDHDPRWCGEFTRFADFDSEIPELAKRKWSVVLMDQSPGERRVRDVPSFLKTAEYIVVHDYCPEWEDAYRDVIPLWPFHKISNRFSPRTLVLGNREIPRS